MNQKSRLSKMLIYALTFVCTIFFNISSSSLIFAGELEMHNEIKLIYPIGDSMFNGKNVGDVDKDGYDDLGLGGFGLFFPDVTIKVLSGKNGEVIHDILIKTTLSAGCGINSAGDYNKDGYPDFIVGCSAEDIALVYSGKDKSELARFRSNVQKETFGISVDHAGDINGDGYSDVIVGAVAGLNSNPNGYIKIFSGKDNSMIVRIDGKNRFDGFGYNVLGLGDVDKDQMDDFGVLAQIPSNNTGGYFNVYSGKGGKPTLLKTINFDIFTYEAHVEQLGDINKDGVEDFSLGLFKRSRSGKGEVRLYSGSDRTLIRTYIANYDPRVDYAFSFNSNVGDFNRDGYDDLMVHAAADVINNFPGYMQLYSGLDGKILLTMNNIGPGSAISVSDGLGDLNDDGRDDFAILNLRAGSPNGVYVTFLGKERTTHTDQGSYQSFKFDYGPKMSGKTMALPGSLTGTSGFPFMGKIIPLTLDDYSNITFYDPAYKTVLDSQGKGEIKLPFSKSQIPAGLKVYHDPVLLDKNAFLIDIRFKPLVLER